MKCQNEKETAITAIWTLWLATIFEPMQMKILHQFSMRLTRSLLNIVIINLKNTKGYPFFKCLLAFIRIGFY